LSQRDFDLEVDENDLQTNFDTVFTTSSNRSNEDVDRLHRKRIKNINKMKRMSLFASATNTQIHLAVSRPSYYQIPIEKVTETSTEKHELLNLANLCGTSDKIFPTILSFLNESELLANAFPVCKQWSDCATVAYTKLLHASIHNDAVDGNNNTVREHNLPILERTWTFLLDRFPWACFLAEGGAKKVFKVFNSSVNEEEALSVMYV
jgi:hypothetical protein